MMYAKIAGLRPCSEMPDLIVRPGEPVQAFVAQEIAVCRTDAGHAVSGLFKGRDQMTSEESGCSGHEDPHWSRVSTGN
jgi:hypothetical protein